MGLLFFLFCARSKKMSSQQIRKCFLTFCLSLSISLFYIYHCFICVGVSWCYFSFCLSMSPFFVSMSLVHCLCFSSSLPLCLSLFLCLSVALPLYCTASLFICFFLALTLRLIHTYTHTHTHTQTQTHKQTHTQTYIYI